VCARPRCSREKFLRNVVSTGTDHEHVTTFGKKRDGCLGATEGWPCSNPFSASTMIGRDDKVFKFAGR